ncbi:MAG: alpha/beta hydrolase fold protein [Bacteroidetes bacterium OLB12]|nr:MAG: alpha/beta hydrolase fold protein [Bacteroidetes bacterium OLB12]
MSLVVREEKDFKFVDEGEGQVLMLLHGLFGALSNWEGVVNHYKKHFRVVIPMLPIYEMPIKEAGLIGLREFTERFVAMKQLDNMIIMGNSLGGHVGILYTLANPEKSFQVSTYRQFGFIRKYHGRVISAQGKLRLHPRTRGVYLLRSECGFERLVDEVFETTKSIPKCMRIVAIAKSAQRNNLALELPNIKVPTLLVWGLNDTITPPMVGHEFNRLIPNSELKFIDKCCHAPMMEHPEKFNRLVEDFLVHRN